MKYIRFIVILLIVVCLTACDELVQKLATNQDYSSKLTSYFEGNKQEAMEVVDVKFSNDYTSFTVTTRMITDGPTAQLKDSTRLRTEVVETIDGIRNTRLSTPTLIGIRNVEAETYDEAVNRQINEVRERSKAHNFDELTQTLERWEM